MAIDFSFTPHAPANAGTHAKMRPCLELFGARILVPNGPEYAQTFEEVDAALARLVFFYGNTRVKSSDRSPNFFVSSPEGLKPTPRNREAELRAHSLLEYHGLIEIDCADDWQCAQQIGADYIVNIDSDFDSLATFNADAVPEFTKLGWEIVFEKSYPCHSPKGPQWYAETTTPAPESVTQGTAINDDGQSGEDDGGWFGLELGIEVKGKRINLLPHVIELLETRGTSMSLEALAKNPKRHIAVPLGGRQYLPVPPERLSSILRILLELYEADRNSAFELPGFRMGALEDLDQIIGPGNLDWGHGARALLKRAHAFTPEALSQVCVEASPEGLQATLRPYQQEGVSWLQNLVTEGVGGILADDMGLGKTLQTIAHLLIEHQRSDTRYPSLVLAPTSLVGNWVREIEKFAPGLKILTIEGPRRHENFAKINDADVVITSYPLLVRDLDRYQERRFHLAILDEAQAIKNTSSKVSQAVQAVEAGHRLCLTGTPIENSLLELWSLFDFLTPGLLGSKTSFREIYQFPIERLGSEERLASLRQRVRPFVLRRMKSEVAKELPPKTQMVRSVQLSGQQRDLYESIRLAAHNDVRKAVKENGMAGSTIDILGALLKLRQCCCDPRLVRMEAAQALSQSAKMETLFEMLNGMIPAGHRILIFSQFTSMLSLIAERCKNENIRHVSLTGETRDRQAKVDAFQNGEAEVFLISLKAGGTGLTLTEADVVIHYDPWWNPAIQAQATDRAYRIGQTKPVFVYNLVVAGSVEERILKLQDRKRSLADGILAPTEAGLGLGENELNELFAPIADDGEPTASPTELSPPAPGTRLYGS